MREYQGGAFVSPLLLAARGGHLDVCKVVRREVEGRSCFYYFGMMDLTKNFTKERMVFNISRQIYQFSQCLLEAGAQLVPQVDRDTVEVAQLMERNQITQLLATYVSGQVM